MKKHIFTLLALGTLAIPSAWAFYHNFGVSGSNGFSGSTGMSGQSGRSAVVFADGNPQTLVLDGTPGANGMPGRDGDDAWSCNQPHRPEHDLRGADGGDGGMGGSGGNGGSGGDVTVYFQDPAQLRTIYVRSLGAQPGMGAPGGRAGRPCLCTNRQWIVEKCRIVKDPVTGKEKKECTNTRYTCDDGQYGRDGMYGSSGHRGRDGRLTLIRSSQPLAPEVLYDSSDISLLTNRSIVLEDNIFVTKSGALGLLAPGSVLQDQYSEFAGRLISSAQVVWNAKRSAADFKGQAVSFSLSGQEVVAQFPAGVWPLISEQTTVTPTGTNKVVSVEEALKESEVRMVSFKVEKTGTETVVRVKDLALQKELLSDVYHVTIWRDKTWIGGGDDRVFDKDVTTADMAVDGNDLLIKIGKLNVEDPDKTFKKGKKIIVKILLTRSFAGRSTKVDSGEIKYTLPKK